MGCSGEIEKGRTRREAKGGGGREGRKAVM